LNSMIDHSIILYENDSAQRQSVSLGCIITQQI